MTEFLEIAKNYGHIIKEDVHLVDTVELQWFEKRIVSFFVVDKRSLKICRSTKNTIIKSLTSLESKN